MIEVKGGRFRLPTEIQQALDDPEALGITVAPDGYLLSPPKRFGRLRGQPRAQKTVEGYETRAIPDGTYGVASYHPSYFLMALDHDPAHGRETYWAGLHGYHEHLPPEQQNTDAQEHTERFVRDWLLPTGGRSFLELGCGAGRNLKELHRQDPGLELRGIDANAEAIDVARRTVPAELAVGSLYDLGELEPVDVVFTAGVLMHVPHDRIEDVIGAMLELSRVAVVHTELHGRPQQFDFHRYPRDYGEVYRRLGVECRYEVEPSTDGTPGETGLLVTR